MSVAPVVVQALACSPNHVLVQVDDFFAAAVMLRFWSAD